MKGYEVGSVSEKSSIYIKEIPSDNIHKIQELGAGTFGKIFKGQVFGLYGNGTTSMIFLKTLREKPSITESQEFQNEINSMHEIRHQHVLSMLGISTKGSPQCILYEHLPLGDLHQFLVSQEAHGSTLQHKEVMYILTQVASGLEYLSCQLYIHKDIAARNIIVSHNLNVKISNLKIIYGLHSTDYCAFHNQMIPVRWVPPETITYGAFTLSTDVYSYGVLMWEVFSNGLQPYYGFANEEVVEIVRSRQLLACPPECPPRIYSLMMECWHESESKRPTAREVHQKMRAWYLDNSNVYALGSTTAPSVSNSSAPSHHSSTGPSNPSNQTNTTELHSCTPVHNVTTETPPYYSTLYPDGIGCHQGLYNGQCQGQYSCPDEISSSCSGSSIDDDDESEFTMPMPSGHKYSSLNRRPPGAHVDYRSQTQPFLTQKDMV